MPYEMDKLIIIVGDFNRVVRCDNMACHDAIFHLQQPVLCNSKTELWLAHQIPACCFQKL